MAVWDGAPPAGASDAVQDHAQVGIQISKINGSIHRAPGQSFSAQVGIREGLGDLDQAPVLVLERLQNLLASTDVAILIATYIDLGEEMR
jgi:hypothetical protein